MDIPYITAEQMQKVDELATTKYNISILQMMENAGRSLAQLTSELAPKQVLVMYGKGNNGGGGLAAARHLAIRNIPVSIIGANTQNNTQVEHQLKTLKAMGITPQENITIEKGTLIIDALLGYNIQGKPKEQYKTFIEQANKSGSDIISLDIPSGMHPDTGEAFGEMIEATHTLTLALPKMGLKKTNEVYLANIGIPPQVFAELKIDTGNPFKEIDIVKIQ